MVTAEAFTEMAMALPGVSAAPHFDRTAFRAGRIFATLGPAGDSVNFRFDPDDQALKCAVLPDAFRPVPNAWGRQGWTIGDLGRLEPADVADALLRAHRHASEKRPVRRRR